MILSETIDLRIQSRIVVASLKNTAYPVTEMLQSLLTLLAVILAEIQLVSGKWSIQTSPKYLNGNRRVRDYKTAEAVRHDYNLKIHRIIFPALILNSQQTLARINYKRAASEIAGHWLGTYISPNSSTYSSSTPIFLPRSPYLH